MLDDRYMRNGAVARDVIAIDIMSRRLTGSELERIADEPVVQKAFFGTLGPIKRPKREWTPDYLDRLCGAVAGECFNREYLLHLDQVADHVSKAKFQKIILTGVVIILVFIAGFLVFLYTLGSADALDDEGSPDEISCVADNPLPDWYDTAQVEEEYV